VRCRGVKFSETIPVHVYDTCMVNFRPFFAIVTPQNTLLFSPSPFSLRKDARIPKTILLRKCVRYSPPLRMESVSVSDGKHVEGPGTIFCGGEATGLMASLAKPRKTFKQNGVGAPRSPVPVDRLPALRVDDRAEIQRTLGAEADDVCALPAKVESAVGSSKLEGVRRMALARKSRHDEAIKDYEALQRRVYTEAEDEVLRCGRELRLSLADVDSRQAAVFEAMSDTTTFVLRDFAWLRDQHAAIDALGSERRQCVTQFADAMERIEANRAGVLSRRLHVLAETLIATGHELQPVIERIIDSFAADVNAIVVGNKREHAHALAELQASPETRDYSVQLSSQ
jgi:hypothetical protein